MYQSSVCSEQRKFEDNVLDFTIWNFFLCRPLKCSICDAVFRTDHLLRKHIKLHEPRERRGKLVATNLMQPPRGRRRAAVIRLTAEETQVLAQQPLDNAATVSEKVLIASVAEKDRISELKVLALLRERSYGWMLLLLIKSTSFQIFSLRIQSSSIIWNQFIRTNANTAQKAFESHQI